MVLKRTNENRNKVASVLTELREIRRLLASASAGAMNREAASAYLSVSTATLDRMASAGKLKPIRLTEGRVAWRRADLDVFLASCESTP